MANVTLRKKALKKGKSSFYLDFWPPIVHPDTGKLIRREYLKLVVSDKPKTDLERSFNKKTLELAESIRAKRLLDLHEGRFGFISSERRNGNFVEFYRSVSDRKKEGTSDNWAMSLKYFVSFAGNDVKLSDLNESFCEDYREYMLAKPSIGRNRVPISVNTAVSYYGKFRTVLRKAFKAKLLNENLYDLTEKIKTVDTARESFDLEELQRLAEIEIEPKVLKQAALFSALTGLRFSDLKALDWSQVRGVSGEFKIQFRQEKTETLTYLPISDQACGLLGERMDGIEKVFEGLKYSQVSLFMAKWLALAGIERRVTFHGFRHTFATLQLEHDTDIYTISKMLGHKSVKTTEIYTKVRDSKKRQAADKLNLNKKV